SVYPNPANDFVTVANAENANIVIVNMLGEVVANVNNASSNQNIDISKLANGTYFVKVDGEVFKINVVK
ncbi:MAG: T9SS type A sorting domain-containing protein, partial [Bacteroidota bacterium]|nr:T9SS type A sorting domain-containing protein [Bacteroidota bacterium]